MRVCPECNSHNVRVFSHMELLCIICNKCGYDEREIYDRLPVQRLSYKPNFRSNKERFGLHQRSSRVLVQEH